MDTSEYMPMFLAETREHLQSLNLAVVRLENNPQDRETVDEIFRIAHSLKGMSATMGFERMAELTHEMEDVFELLRQRTGGLTSDAIDTVFSCLDVLSGAVEDIEQTGQEALDPAPVITRLRRLVRPRTPEQQAASEGADVLIQAGITAAQAAGARVLHVKAKLSADVMMPAVRAHMLFAALSDHGELVGTVPKPEAIELFSGSELHAWLVTEHEEEAVSVAALNVSEVTTVEIYELGQPDRAADAPSPATEPVLTATEPVLTATEPVLTATEPVLTATDAPAPETPITTAPGASTPGASVVEAPAAETAPQPTPPKLAPAPAPAPAAAADQHATRTVRVDAERLDALMHAMGELVIHRTGVEALTSNLEIPGLQQAIQELTRSSQLLQSMVMQVRMIPVDVVFLRLPRLVRDLAAKLGKEVKLDLVGTDTELDRTVVDALGDPLVHLVRNSLDHGLEPAEERAAGGKPPTGKLEISARHAGGSVVISVCDDGRGIDPERVAQKALERGLIDAQTASEIDMRGAIELLFAPGFSTLETSNNISGRGVGMDAVRTQIRSLGGEVLVESVQGGGTTAQIRLPLTLAIVSALHIDIAGAPFAIPLDRIERTLRTSQQIVRSVAGSSMLVLEDGILPLLDGARSFGRERTGDPQFVVVLRAQERRFGLSVDGLVGQRELVTRPLPAIVANGEPVSAGAALADGQLALIIDCDALAASAIGLIQTSNSMPAVPARMAA